ncbi:MAG: glycoside hydrolase family 2 TIM barrel-domain containing protein [Bacteroidaceae bacterium]
MWSLGNEAGIGPNFTAMHQLAHKLDPTRPTHYHFDTPDRSCDILGGFYRNVATEGYKEGANRYLSIPNLEFAATSDHFDRPILMNEFCHAMGNAVGNLTEYVQLFDKYPKLVGVCIWDWVDQGVLTKTEDGESYYGFDGDFGGVHSGFTNFCLNGLIFPDRTYGGKLTEVKAAYSNIWADLKQNNKKEATITIHNKNVFDELKDKCMDWTLYKDGQAIENKTVSDITTPSQWKRVLTCNMEI